MSDEIIKNSEEEIKQENETKPKLPAIRKISAESSGSATGNPRNKVALRPGHSLMDWVRIGNSGKDLTGFGGVIKEVSSSELAKHNKTNDCWIAVKGRVYNVTHYLDFHPGGIPELMRGAGKDATSLFNQVHAWVNFEQILQKCLIGPLRGGLLFSSNDSSTTNFAKKLFGKKTPELPPPPTASSTAISSANKLPRLDWFQQLASITIVLYSGLVPRGSNKTPPWVRTSLDEDGRVVKIYVVNVGGNAGNTYTACLNLYAPVRWPPTAVRIHPDSGKVEVVFIKEKEELWNIYGESSDGHGISGTDTEIAESKWWQTNVQESNQITHNMKLIKLQFKQRIAITIPIGAHFRVRLTGSDISRSYTPVGPNIKSIAATTNDCLILMIKSYSDGYLSSKLCNIQSNSDEIIEISDPIITFDARKITSAASIYLAAAGTGITPMLRIITLALQDPKRACKKIHLMFFNRTEDDIVWRDQLQNLSEEDERFEITHVLSDTDDDKNWTGLTGRVNKELLEKLLNTSDASNLEPLPALVCLCGPEIFTVTTKTLLEEMGIKEENLHCFLG